MGELTEEGSGGPQADPAFVLLLPSLTRTSFCFSTAAPRSRRGIKASVPVRGLTRGYSRIPSYFFHRGLNTNFRTSATQHRESGNDGKGEVAAPHAHHYWQKEQNQGRAEREWVINAFLAHQWDSPCPTAPPKWGKKEQCRRLVALFQFLSGREVNTKFEEGPSGALTGLQSFSMYLGGGKQRA